MTEIIRKPTERICEDCNREEHYNPDTGSWETTTTGIIQCIHRWNIDGTFCNTHQ